MISKKTAIIFALGLLAEILAVIIIVAITKDDIPLTGESEIVLDNREDYKLIKPKNLTYKEIFPEPSFENLKMIGYVESIGVRAENSEMRLYGMILRSLRFKNITTKVEKKYGLPENLILAMVMQESGGVDLLPNSSDDGGLGLCHMQPYMANLFNLKTYQNCKKMVSREHGRALRQLISDNNMDKKLLLEFDDRFHPILNLDAAGRMLAYYMNGPQTQNSPVKTAIYGYAGRINYPEYYKRVKEYWKKLNDRNIIKKVEAEFNNLNPFLRINGKDADFNGYILTHQQQNRNYGLDKY